MHVNLGRLKFSTFTRDYIWYGNDRTLHRRHLKTNADEKVRVFAAPIRRLETCAGRCVVATSDRITVALWTSPYRKPLATKAWHWIATPNRIVFSSAWTGASWPTICPP